MNFFRHFQIHMRVVIALILREIATRYNRSAGGYLWAFLEPLANIFIMASVFSLIARTPPIGRTFALFFATGFFAFHIYKSVEGYTNGAIRANKSLLMFPIVTILDVIWARLLLQLLTLIAVFPVLMALIYRISSERVEIDLSVLIIAFSWAAILGFGQGMIHSVVFPLIPIYEKLYKIASAPLMIMSGVVLLPENLPAPYGEWLYINPLVHLVAYFRTAFYPTYDPNSLSLAYLGGATILSLVMGLCLVTWYGNKVKEI